MQDSLHKKYDDFPGGYFDAGGVHWLLRDGLGSVGMTVDNTGKVEQHVQYYPYGEPHREPQGQPYLYGGKERGCCRTTSEKQKQKPQLSQAEAFLCP